MENSSASSLISIISSMLDKNVINITSSDSGIFLNEISKKNYNYNQPCVCSACVTCTSVPVGCRPVHIEKNGKQIEICNLSELNKKDIKLTEPFAKCKKTEDNLCTVSVVDIENREWQMIDGTRSQGVGRETLNHLISYMICTKGPGIIYFTSAGQVLKNFANNYSFKKGEMKLSENGKKLIKSFELSLEIIKAWDLGEFDKNGNLIGIYPYYVFKKNSKGQYISDGGITIGYGHYISSAEYKTDLDEKNIIDTYAPGASFSPPYIPADGSSYKVPNSNYIPINEIDQIFNIDIEVAENAVNNYLKSSPVKLNQVELNQNQFDALVSFTHQYGANWWIKTPEKVLPKFIREGKDFDDEAKVKSIFGQHDSKKRREKEAEVFLNGY